MHTYDAPLTVGTPQPLPAEVALDGVEDFLFTCCTTTAAWTARTGRRRPPRYRGSFLRLRLSAEDRGPQPLEAVLRAYGRPALSGSGIPGRVGGRRLRPGHGQRSGPGAVRPDSGGRPGAGRRPAALRPARGLGPGGVGAAGRPVSWTWWRVPRRRPPVRR